MKHQIELSAENLWSEISGRLQEALNDGTYSKWFGGVRGLELDGDTLVLPFPTSSRATGSRHFRGLLDAAVRDITGGEPSLELPRRERAGYRRGESRADGRRRSLVQRLPRRPEAAASRRSTRSTPS